MDKFTLTISGSTTTLSFGTRDWSLMSAVNPFAQKGAAFRRYISDPPTASVVSGHYRGHCYERQAGHILVCAKNFIAEMEATADLLAYDYSFSFTAPPPWARGGGGRSVGGFSVGGLQGSVRRVRGGAFVLVELLQSGPDGQGRVVEYLDMRAVRHLETDDWGTLKVARRKGRFDTLEKVRGLVSFVRANADIGTDSRAAVSIDTRDRGIA